MFNLVFNGQQINKVALTTLQAAQKEQGSLSMNYGYMPEIVEVVEHVEPKAEMKVSDRVIYKNGVAVDKIVGFGKGNYRTAKHSYNWTFLSDLIKWVKANPELF